MAEDDLEEDYDDADSSMEDDGEGGGSKKKLLLLILLPLLLIIGGVAGAYFAGLMDPILDMFGGSEDMPAVEESAAPDSHDGGEGGGVAGQAVFYDLDQIVVDLNTSGRRRSYIQMRLSLQLGSQQDVLRVEEVMPRIMDSFITFLRELRLEDLQGTAGMYRIQEELLIRVNNAAAPVQVQDVLFKEMLIQ